MLQLEGQQVVIFILGQILNANAIKTQASKLEYL